MHNEVEKIALNQLIAQEQLNLVLSRLSPRQLELLVLHLDGLNHEEISWEYGLEKSRVDQIFANIRRVAGMTRETHPNLFE